MSQTSLLSFKQLVQHGHLHPSSYQNHLEVSFLDDVRCLRCRPVIVPSLWFFFGVFFGVSRIMLSGFPVIYLYKPYIYNWGYSYMGHGQYLVYSSKSSIFEECIVVFQVLVYKQMFFFEECIVVFQAPAQFPKKKMSRILLSINLNFGWSSYMVDLWGFP